MTTAGNKKSVKIVKDLINIFYLHRNLIKIIIKYKFYPKSGKLAAFEPKYLGVNLSLSYGGNEA